LEETGIVDGEAQACDVEGGIVAGEGCLGGEIEGAGSDVVVIVFEVAVGLAGMGADDEEVVWAAERVGGEILLKFEERAIVKWEDKARAVAETEAVGGIGCGMEVYAVAVAGLARGGEEGCDGEITGEAADASQDVNELFMFEAELFIVGNVLVLAAAAGREVRAEGGGAVRGSGEDGERFGEEEALLALDDARADMLAGEDERDEYDTAICAADAVAAEGHVGDEQFYFGGRLR